MYIFCRSRTRIVSKYMRRCYKNEVKEGRVAYLTMWA
jgi:hypothetical protein